METICPGCLHDPKDDPKCSVDAAAFGCRRMSKVDGWYFHWLWTRDGSWGDAFGTGCQEGTEDRSVAGVLVEIRLGRTWVTKSDHRMVASGETRLELDWG
eukprot:2236838-Ditylum_brightwellii.AAC.1